MERTRRTVLTSQVAAARSRDSRNRIPERSLFRMIEIERHRIDAITLGRRLWSVVENMAEMRIALRAYHFGPDHAVAVVSAQDQLAFIDGPPETRPTAS